MENAPITAANVQAVQGKLQALFDDLPPPVGHGCRLGDVDSRRDEAMENAPITAANVQVVQGKLQALFDDLDHEKPVMEALLAHAAEGGRQSAESSGGQETSIIIVGGRPERTHIPINPGVLVELNPQPIPPGIPDRREDAE